MRVTSGDLRRRSKKSNDHKGESDDFTETFKKFDLFPKFEKKTKQQSKVKTSFGGIISFIGCSFIAWLVLSEVYYFIFPSPKEHVGVDIMFEKKLKIYVDIEFPRIPCVSLGIDVMDVTGEQQVHVEQEIKKFRLDFSGNILGELKEHDHHSMENNILNIINPWQNMRLDPHKEGCRIKGNLHVQKVNGNFHIALGSAHRIGGKHIHQFVLSDVPKFNCSHIIHKLSFGDPFRYQNEPLNGISHTIKKEGGGVFTYYIKVIPTQYYNSFGYKTNSNQFHHTFKYRHIPVPKPGERPYAALPGVFFVYEMNPYMLKIDCRRQSFLKFVVNLCAITGGIYALSGILDSFVFNFSVLRKAKKIILNTVNISPSEV